MESTGNYDTLRRLASRRMYELGEAAAHNTTVVPTDSREHERERIVRYRISLETRLGCEEPAKYFYRCHALVLLHVELHEKKRVKPLHQVAMYRPISFVPACRFSWECNRLTKLVNVQT